MRGNVFSDDLDCNHPPTESGSDFPRKLVFFFHSFCLFVCLLWKELTRPRAVTNGSSRRTMCGLFGIRRTPFLHFLSAPLLLNNNGQLLKVSIFFERKNGRFFFGTRRGIWDEKKLKNKLPRLKVILALPKK